ncbi:MAG: RNA-binding protein [Chitinophagales bacterium]
MIEKINAILFNKIVHCVFKKAEEMDIYAGSLPFKMTEKELRSLFENYGEVESVKIVIDKITRQNKGFGFVVMPNDDEANLAINSLDGYSFGERSIIVTKSEPKSEKEKKRPFGKGFKGGNYAGKSSKSNFRNNQNNKK